MDCIPGPEKNIYDKYIIFSWNLPACEKKTHTCTGHTRTGHTRTGYTRTGHTCTGRHLRKICFKKLTSDISCVKNNFNELILDLSLILSKRKQIEY